MSNMQYEFSFLEVKKLVKLFYNTEKPIELEKFFTCLETHVYNNMTIEEAEMYLNEK